MTDRCPGWARTTIWYHVYALGACGADRTNPAPGAEHGPLDHRLQRLLPWVDHVADLGATGIVLGPVFESETHGYDTVDYFRVDRRLGDQSDLVRLFEVCHARGIRVVLDGVFNHVGRSFAPLADVLAHGPESRWASWFRCRFDGGAVHCDTFEGHDRLVVFNHDSPEVVEYLSGVATYWLDQGADGFRLDAAYAAPTSFWRSLTDQVGSSHPDAFVFGEMIHGDYSRFVERAGVAAVTQYELWKAIWSALNDENFFELAHALKRHAGYCETFVPYTFVGNHDVTRIATQLKDPRHVAHAAAVLFTVPGTPSIYYGDELGFTGLKRHEAGGDDDIRPPLPSDGIATSDALELHRSLITLRREHPWLSTAAIDPVHVANRSLGYVVSDGDNRIAAALNVHDAPTAIPLPGGQWRVLAGAAEEVHSDRVALSGHGWAVLAPG